LICPYPDYRCAIAWLSTKARLHAASNSRVRRILAVDISSPLRYSYVRKRRTRRAASLRPEWRPIWAFLFPPTGHANPRFAAGRRRGDPERSPAIANKSAGRLRRPTGEGGRASNRCRGEPVGRRRQRSGR
jgi:hypothetical protein